MPKKEIAIKHATILGAYLLIVWGFYRNAARLPETIEELVIKPVLWLIPVAYLLKKEGLGLRSLGVNMQNLFPSVYLAVILGVVFALEGVFVNYVKYDQVEFAANLGEIAFSTLLLLSVVTAVVEELTFRGYLFNRVWHGLGNEWVANFAVSAVWGMIHVPIAVFGGNLTLYQLWYL